MNTNSTSKSIEVHNEKTGQTFKLEGFEGSTVKELLQEIQVNAQTVLVTRGNEVLTTDDLLQDNDNILLLSVISGG